MSDIEDLKQSIGSNNIEQASVILTELYGKWDDLDSRTQAEIKEIEPVYLTMVNACYEA